MEKKEFIRISGQLADGFINEDDIHRFDVCFRAYQLNYPAWERLFDEEKEEVLSTVNSCIRKLIGMTDLNTKNETDKEEVEIKLIFNAKEIVISDRLKDFLWKYHQQVKARFVGYKNDADCEKKVALINEFGFNITK